uniref:Right handed beta helix domain-containing protein n=1 Tax=Amphimedon queenslandica TaxID=400682 RepID=A0A1X7UF84_AMPQE
YQQEYYGRQGVFFFDCQGFQVSKVHFRNNNGYGLVLYDSTGGHIQQNIFSINSIKNSHHLSAKEKSKIMGGGLHIIQNKGYTSPYIISGNQFINNSAPNIGGALLMDLSYCAGFNFSVTDSSFIGNMAGIAGGAMAFM